MLKHTLWLLKHYVIKVVAILQIHRLVPLPQLSYLKVALVLSSAKSSQLVSPVYKPSIKATVAKATYSKNSRQAVQFLKSSQYMSRRCCEAVMMKPSTRGLMIMEQQVCSLRGRWKRDPDLCLRGTWKRDPDPCPQASLTKQTTHLGLWKL